jgi:outer membrane protein assembly factor BamB
VLAFRPVLHWGTGVGRSAKAAIVGAAVLLASSLTAVPGLADWPTYHLNNARTGNDTTDPAFQSIAKLWSSATLDGLVYAEPVLAGTTLLVATENDTVYALDATSGSQLWSTSVGTSVPASTLGCSNIDPNGITSTPVINPTGTEIYVLGLTWDGALASSVHFELTALQVASGNVLWHKTIAPARGSPSLPTFDPLVQGQRGALSLNNGTVYIPFGGRVPDCGNYRGWVAGTPATALGAVASFEVPSPNRGNGIWASSGAAIDATGNVYATTGNTFSSGTFDYGESVLKLPAGLGQTITDYFAPSNWQALDNADTDLGSVGPLLLGGNLLFQVGKEGVGYLLDTNNLGGANHMTPRFSAQICSTTSDAAFGGTAYAAPYLYVPCHNELVAVNVTTGATPSFAVAWRGPAVPYSGPAIIADGLVWTIDYNGILYGLDPATGAKTFTTNLAGSAANFSTPAAGGGRVFVPDGDHIETFGETPPSGKTFYFAEGFTGTGFTESLSLLTPSQSGTATIDYYTEQGHQPPVTVTLTAGRVFQENVNADVGPNHQVSARVVLSVPGIVERIMHFNNGSWLGSTDQVGTPSPSQEWDFAEGSTLSAFAEYLSLQNPNPSSVIVDLHYFTDRFAQPTKTLTVAANSRVTIVVPQGDLNDNGSCMPLTSCGVGPGTVGVSVQVVSRSLPIVAERPMYVMNYSFGSGRIRDGHDAFGANTGGTQWNFAEGTTLSGFNEYLTIQNPVTSAAHVNLRYIDDAGVVNRALTVAAQSRATVLVFDASHNGVGAGYVGVSVQVTSDVPIIAERPIYMVRDFGTGSVAGAHDVVGATTFGKLFGFSALSTAAGENDYLTIQNPNSAAANLTLTYYESTGAPIVKAFVVPANSRHTVLVFGTAEGVGAGVSPLGVVLSSDLGVMVEKPTYNSTTPGYGATDTQGVSPATF